MFDSNIAKSGFPQEVASKKGLASSPH